MEKYNNSWKECACGGGKRDSGIEFLKISAVILIIISHVVQTVGTPNSYVPFQDYVVSLDTAT